MFNYRYNVIVVLAVIFLYLDGFGYGRNFSETINYSPSGNGRRLTVRFVLNYDAMMNEPLVKAAAKVVDMGSEVTYKGKVWSDPAVTKSVKPSLISVAVDIIDNAGHRISSVTFRNLLDWDVAGSPNWGGVWPGVSAENTK